MNFLTLSFLLLFLVYFSPPLVGQTTGGQQPQNDGHPSEENKGPWKSWDEGYQLAQQTNRTVFYFIYSIKCENCKKVFTEHFARPDLATLIAQYYIPVLAEVDEEKDVLVHYKGQTLKQDSLQRKLLELANFTAPGYRLPLLFFVQPNPSGVDTVHYSDGYIELDELMKKINLYRPKDD